MSTTCIPRSDAGDDHGRQDVLTAVTTSLAPTQIQVNALMLLQQDVTHPEVPKEELQQLISEGVQRVRHTPTRNTLRC
jgi:hypothetical protein